MVGYYIASFTATIICTLLGIFVGPLFGVDYRWGFMSIAMLVVLFLIDALLAWLIRKLPEKWFDSNNKHFDERKGERKFYEALGIKKWKDKIPELGGFTDFHKDPEEMDNNSIYLSLNNQNQPQGNYVYEDESLH